MSVEHLACNKYVYAALSIHTPEFLPQYLPGIPGLICHQMLPPNPQPHTRKILLVLSLCSAPGTLQPHFGVLLASCRAVTCFSLSAVSAPLADTTSTLRVSCPCDFLLCSIDQVARVAEPAVFVFRDPILSGPGSFLSACVLRGTQHTFHL